MPVTASRDGLAENQHARNRASRAWTRRDDARQSLSLFLEGVKLEFRELLDSFPFVHP
jgi:hypothetical protein